MKLEIKEIINNLKLANKNNLDKIYLQIEDDEKTEIINLEPDNFYDIARK